MPLSVPVKSIRTSMMISKIFVSCTSCRYRLEDGEWYFEDRGQWRNLFATWGAVHATLLQQLLEWEAEVYLA